MRPVKLQTTTAMDGLSFNFDTLPAATGSQSKSAKSKAAGGRWTDRVKRLQKNKRKRNQAPDSAAEAATVPAVSVKASQAIATTSTAVAANSLADLPFAEEIYAANSALKPRTNATKTTAGTAGPSHGEANNKKQYISSLFSSMPEMPAPQPAQKQPAAPAKPSNAPSDGSFESLSILPQLAALLQSPKFGLKRPTPVQKLSISHLMNSALHNDTILQAQTGSGKTLAYLLPLVQDLLSLSAEFAKEGKPLDRSVGTLAIVLAPTRELANQIYEVAQNLLSFSSSHAANRVSSKGKEKANEDNDEEEDDHISPRWLTPGLLSGGMSRQHEKARLRKGVPLLIATVSFFLVSA